ncbi:uncharacterized protein LOC144700191 isoform X2 [Wolffia australiana]
MVFRRPFILACYQTWINCYCLFSLRMCWTRAMGRFLGALSSLPATKLGSIAVSLIEKLLSIHFDVVCSKIEATQLLDFQGIGVPFWTMIALAIEGSRRPELIAYRRATKSANVRTLLAATRNVATIQPHSLGDTNATCASCHSKMWIQEHKPSSSQRNPLFHLCCKDG